MLKDDKDVLEGNGCTYIKRTKLEKRCLAGVGVGSRSKEKTSLTSVSVGGGCGRLLSERIMGNPDRTVTSLNILLQSIHKDRKRGTEGCVKKKKARELIRNRAQSPLLR